MFSTWAVLSTGEMGSVAWLLDIRVETDRHLREGLLESTSKHFKTCLCMSYGPATASIKCVSVRYMCVEHQWKAGALECRLERWLECCWFPQTPASSGLVLGSPDQWDPLSPLNLSILLLFSSFSATLIGRRFNNPLAAWPRNAGNPWEVTLSWQANPKLQTATVDVAPLGFFTSSSQTRRVGPRLPVSLIHRLARLPFPRPDRSLPPSSPLPPLPIN